MNAKQRQHHYGRITLDRVIHRQRVAQMSAREWGAYRRKRIAKRDNRRKQRAQRRRNRFLAMLTAMRRDREAFVTELAAASEAAAGEHRQFGIDLANGLSVGLSVGISVGVQIVRAVYDRTSGRILGIVDEVKGSTDADAN